MNKTPHMRADELAHEFNACRERGYWRALTGGTRTAPTVIFKSQSAMVELTWHANTDRMTILYTKVSCAFGDFMSSAYAALMAVLTAMKASGHDVEAPLEGSEGVVRIEYDPRTKTASVALAKLDDVWGGDGEVPPLGTSDVVPAYVVQPVIENGNPVEQIFDPTA